jgi:hypothetical protein
MRIDVECCVWEREKGGKGEREISSASVYASIRLLCCCRNPSSIKIGRTAYVVNISGCFNGAVF